MNTFNLPLTSQQARNLLILIDLAVKAGGLQVASQAVVFQSLITRAAEQADAAVAAAALPVAADSAVDAGSQT